MAANGAAIGARIGKLRRLEFGKRVRTLFFFSLDASFQRHVAEMREMQCVGSFNRSVRLDRWSDLDPVQPVRSIRSNFRPIFSKLVSKFSFR